MNTRTKTFICPDCDEWCGECRCNSPGIFERVTKLGEPLVWMAVCLGYAAAIIIAVMLMWGDVQAQSFTVDPPAGIAPVKVTLVWDIPGAASCEASGSWTGTKAPKGTLTTTINAAASYTLTCVKPGTGGSATLSWVPPKANTNGAPLTNGAGYTIVHGLTETTMDRPLDVQGIASTTYTITDLPAGMHWFGIQSYNSEGTRSARVVVSKNIVVTPGAQNFAATVRVDVTLQPNPPTDVRIVFGPGESQSPVATVSRINLGGPAVTDSQGNAWSADTCRNGSTSNSRADIQNTTDDVLYQSLRYSLPENGPIVCAIPVSVPSLCEVEMLTSEEYFISGGRAGTGPGLRVFEMWAEGALLIPDIDIYRDAGEHTPLIRRASVQVLDGTLNVEFRHKVENPTVAGLRVSCIPA